MPPTPFVPTENGGIENKAFRRKYENDLCQPLPRRCREQIVPICDAAVPYYKVRELADKLCTNS